MWFLSSEFKTKIVMKNSLLLSSIYIHSRGGYNSYWLRLINANDNSNKSHLRKENIEGINGEKKGKNKVARKKHHAIKAFTILSRTIFIEDRH